MSSQRLRERIPEASVVEIARLSGWELVWDKVSKDGSGKANLLKGTKENIVWGVVYRVPNEKVPDLDRIEGGYQRVEIEVEFPNRDKCIAFTYISDNRDKNLEPYQWYKDLVVKGAE